MTFDMTEYLANTGNKLGNSTSQIGRKSVDPTTLRTAFSDYLEIWDCRHVATEQSVVGTSLIYGHPVYGIWGTGSWASELTTPENIISVTNSHNIFPEGFWNERFKHPDTTADWNTSEKRLDFSTGSTSCQSSSIWLDSSGNNEISTATISAIGSNLDNLNFYVRSEDNSWEEITLGTTHTLINSGSDLQWKSTLDSGEASISYLEIDYTTE